MEINGKKFLVIGGAGLIGSHAVEQLAKHDVGEIVIFDNFARGSLENLDRILRDPRVKIFEAGGDVCQPDILDAAMKGKDVPAAQGLPRRPQRDPRAAARRDPLDPRQ